MKQISVVMGCPLWLGKVKARVAKKHLIGVFRNRAYLTEMSQIKPGDLISDCSSFNVRVASVEPRYYTPSARWVGGTLRTLRFRVLVDIDITNDKGGICSLAHCGVELPRSREDIIRDWEERIPWYIANGDTWDFAKRYEFTTVLPDGQAIVDYEAMYRKYPETDQRRNQG
jgi:hypothetical protein